MLLFQIVALFREMNMGLAGGAMFIPGRYLTTCFACAGETVAAAYQSRPNASLVRRGNMQGDSAGGIFAARRKIDDPGRHMLTIQRIHQVATMRHFAPGHGRRFPHLLGRGDMRVQGHLLAFQGAHQKSGPPVEKAVFHGRNFDATKDPDIFSKNTPTRNVFWR